MTVSWWDAFVVLDVETNGLEAGRDRVLELGVARFERGTCVEKCNYLVHAPVKLDPKFERINGLTQELVDSAAGWPFARVWESIAGLLEGAYPVAFNAPFDRRFLQSEIRCHQGAWSAEALRAAHVHEKDRIWIDPLVYVRQFDRYEKSKKLVDACARRGIVIERAHQAVWDCVATGQLLLTLCERLPADTEALLTWQMELAVHEAYNYAAYQAKKNGQSVDAGHVFICDACHARAFSQEKTSLPEEWSFYNPTSSDTSVTCSTTCDVQMLWWDDGQRAQNA